jgi:hypothetical protein
MGLQALFIVRKYPYQTKEMRENIAAERVKGTSAQVQVCTGEFVCIQCFSYAFFNAVETHETGS